MSNLGFYKALTEHGLTSVKTAVGDKYVVEEMLKGGYNFGGEQSGHIIFLDYNTTGDGLLNWTPTREHYESDGAHAIRLSE